MLWLELYIKIEGGVEIGYTRMVHKTPLKEAKGVSPQQSTKVQETIPISIFYTTHHKMWHCANTYTLIASAIGKANIGNYKASLLHFRSCIE